MDTPLTVMLIVASACFALLALIVMNNIGGRAFLSKSSWKVTGQLAEKATHGGRLRSPIGDRNLEG